MTQTIYASNMYDSEKMRVSWNSAYVSRENLINKIYQIFNIVKIKIIRDWYKKIALKILL